VAAALDKAFNVLDAELQTIAALLVGTQWVALLAAVLAAVWLSRGSWGQAAYEATLGKFALPDPRNAVLCGLVPVGWCIMNVCCPFVCAKYHPPFRLRIILVKARHLHEGLEDAGGPMAVYAEVRAGTNPVKTTSVQTYQRRTKAGDGHDTVWWNEPVDVVMRPAATSVTIDLYRSAARPLWIGTLHVPVDAVYEPPGTCTECNPCGYSGAKLCSRFFGTEYRWPFVRGLPRPQELYEVRPLFHDCVPGSGGDEDQWKWQLLDAYDVFHESSGPAAPAPADGPKGKALRQVKRDGARLAELPPQLQADRDVVLASVQQNGDAIRFATPELQQDMEVQRVACRAPRPLILPLNRGGEEAGKLWVYFIFHSLDEEEDLPYKMPLGV